MSRILTSLDIDHQPSDPLRVLPEKLRAYILFLRKGKRIEREQQAVYGETTRFNEQVKQIHESWPQLVPQALKDKIIKIFRERTSSEALTTFTCASCAETVPLISQCSLSLDMFHTEIIKRPDRRLDDDLVLERYKWLHPECVPPSMPLDGNDVLDDLLLAPDGVSFASDGSPPLLSLCSVCHSSLKNSKVPPLSLASKLFLGPVPDELKDLTVIEEGMIARCRSKAVNAGHVRAALQWLKTHDHLYKDIQINEECFRQLNENPVLPFSIEHILPSAANETSTARFDSIPLPPNDSTAHSNDILKSHSLTQSARHEAFANHERMRRDRERGKMWKCLGRIQFIAAGSARKFGDTYSPDMLPDHKVPYFPHEKSRLVQRQFKDENGNLIAPHELSGKLTEGTLFSAQDHNPRFMDSKVYHVNVEKLTVLDKGDGAPWNPSSPGLPSATPSTPSKRACDPAINSAFDGLFPSKKARAAYKFIAPSFVAHSK
ncbi:hypothetical protein DFH08DRAFT_814896 [Mycena albidolilacea]|uniref:DUF6570 domain-containing protein n=1 Tax=Mycena albidolilacea TaxID=1033008 RepID=A0AAD7EK04_9AGAR|nr:hypothetical protein DFH08DRAFT_814896 [Mycena albidolilacea]